MSREPTEQQRTAWKCPDHATVHCINRMDGVIEPSARQVRFLGACLEYARGVVELSVLRVLGEIGNMRNDDSVGMSGVGLAPQLYGHE